MSSSHALRLCRLFAETGELFHTPVGAANKRLDAIARDHNNILGYAAAYQTNFSIEKAR